MSIVFQIEKIENGFLISFGNGGFFGSDSKHFCRTVMEVYALVERVVDGWVQVKAEKEEVNGTGDILDL
jgi:hypothetical protein